MSQCCEGKEDICKTQPGMQREEEDSAPLAGEIRTTIDFSSRTHTRISQRIPDLPPDLHSQPEFFFCQIKRSSAWERSDLSSLSLRVAAVMRWLLLSLFSSAACAYLAPSAHSARTADCERAVGILPNLLGGSSLG